MSQFNKLFSNNVYISLAIIIVLLAGSTATWFYLEKDMPKKMPVRARQVFLQATDCP